MKNKNKKPVDIKYIGVPNICFSLTDADDKREIQFKQQRIERGFDDSETWSLRDTIAKFIIPRLKVFKEVSIKKVKKKRINKMIRAFELVARDKGLFILTDEELKEYKKGMKIFHKDFLGLWW